MAQCYNLHFFFNNIAKSKLLFLTLLLFIFSNLSFGQTFTDNTPLGTEVWTVPAGVTSITVECWGAGGGGGGDSQNGNIGGAGGGGGGAYASSIIAVTPGQNINYFVGSRGIGVLGGTGTNGQDTWFSTAGTLNARGGLGGQRAQDGRAGGNGGGIAPTSIGTTLFQGANGVSGTATIGAAGGNGANSGGNGGAQRTTEGNGNTGGLPGGGGGGALTTDNTNHDGGDGGHGQVIITYSPCSAPTINATTAITNTTATINWTAPASGPAPTGYEYVVSTSNTAPAGAGTADAGSPANISSLTLNTTYYIFIRTNCGSGVFSAWAGPVAFTTANGPVNDDPCGAIVLTPGATCSVTSDNTVGSTPTTVAPTNLAGCGSHGGVENDVWFTTTVGPTGGVQIDAFDVGVMDPVIAVYTAASCAGPFPQLGCDDDSGPLNFFDAQLIITGRTPGEVLYIRVWDYNGGNDGPFDICVTTVPDPCLSIVNIPSCGATTINATIAAGNGGFDDSCFATPGNEQIYSFTPTVTGNYSITQITTFDHINYGLNTACGPTGWTCIDDLTGNGQTTSLFSLTNGTTYYIMLDSEITTGGNVSFTLNCPPPVPPNDNCGGTTLACDVPQNGTTNGATFFNPIISPCGLSDYGVWYTFAGDDQESTITVDPVAGYDVEMYIGYGACGSLTNQNATCIDAVGAGGIETYTFVSNSSRTYYVYVAHFSAGGTITDTGDFVISRTCVPAIPPPNDDPCAATDLVVNAQCVPLSSTNRFATDTTGIPAPTCGNYQGGDVWFTVTVPPSAQITIDTQSAGITDTAMSIYAAASCSGAIAEIACDDNSGTGNMPMIALTAAQGIVPGQVLYIRVWDNGNNNFGSFGICATTTVGTGQIGVTHCAGEPSESMTTDMFCFDGGVSLGSTITGNLDASSPQAFSQVWSRTSAQPCLFSGFNFRRYDAQVFTVSADATYVFAITNNTFSSNDPMGYIYDNAGTTVPGTCGTGYIAGDDDSGPGLDSEITAFLQAGVTYTLITTNALGNSTETGSYTWDTGSLPTSAEWYTTATGGTPIGYGAVFNPVGVAGSGIPDTNTPGTTTFYIACPNSAAAREPITYTINATPSVAISATTTGGSCGTTEISISVTDASSATAWQVFYAIDGITQPFVIVTTSPHTFTATAPAGAVYTLVSARSGNPILCDALPADLTGSGVVVGTGSKVWNGSSGSDWNTAANWTPNAVPTSADCVIIPPVSLPDLDPIISGTTDANAGSLTVQNGGDLYAIAGATITVVDVVTIDTGGVFELEGVQQNAAQLIQVNDVTNVVNGTFNLVRETNVRSQDFAYWSSPVEAYNFTSFGSALTYHWIPTVGANLGDHGVWSGASGIMAEGKGYAVRLTGTGNGNTASWETITFDGVPRNGNVSLGIKRGTYIGGPINPGPGQDNITNEDDNWNLIGNPYPSALNANTFLNDAANNDIEGSVYIWTHGTSIFAGGTNSPFYGSYVYNYNRNMDYLTYNDTGGTQSGYDGWIGSGQGFFVKMLEVGTTSDGGVSYDSSISFNNAMRDAVSSRNDQFFKTTNTVIERHRIWLDLITPSQSVNRTLVAYVEGATLEKDRNFDASVISGNGQGIYSIINTDTDLIIQGRPLPFITEDKVRIGMNLKEIGEQAIAINTLDGLFEETAQDIFIEDLELGIIHNLRASPYFFTINEIGRVDDRFLLRYTDNSLTIDEFNQNSGINIIAPNSDYIKVTSATSPIETVTVYDMLGRVIIEEKNINESEFSINNNLSDGAFIVKATLIDGKQKIQKVVLKQ